VKPITIIGGGLAGLTLGIALRQQGVATTVIEAGHYPRHRVCGEFISGGGLNILQELGLAEMVRGLGVHVARSAAFFTKTRALGTRPLPAEALCISRFALDAALSRKLCELGGTLRQGERWRDAHFGAGVVCASGRRAQAVENGWRWFGFKIHARGALLDADLEMHLNRNSYVGLCRLVDGEVNVCGLFRRRASENARGESLNWLRGKPGTRLFARLARAEFDSSSFCAVAGLSLRPQPIDERECRIGDALTMIPPITGNGMSMAFESAHLALEPLLAFARGEESWERVAAQVACSLRRGFARRLHWAGVLHRLIFSPFASASMRLLLHATPAWRASFALTR
jgi:menaquinone-9 beta-reductase